MNSQTLTLARVSRANRDAARGREAAIPLGLLTMDQ
jgi:hypothetical protein